MNLSKHFGIGCGDNSCRWGAPGGMGTNGGCRCDKDERVANPRTQDEVENRFARHRGISVLRDLADARPLLAGLEALAFAVRSALVDEVKVRLIEAANRGEPTLSSVQLEDVLVAVEKLRRPS